MLRLSQKTIKQSRPKADSTNIEDPPLAESIINNQPVPYV